MAAGPAAAGPPGSSDPGDKGEKPWYRQQHDIAARARSEGALLASHAIEHANGEIEFEMWRSGDDLVALLTADAADATKEVTVLASTTFRSGPLSREMGRTLSRSLPAPSALSRAKERLRSPRLAGMVHVYVLPAFRGHGHGEALARSAMEHLGARGFSHALTLADDRGSGKLREWYGDLGFVGMEEFGDTAMVARVPK